MNIKSISAVVSSIVLFGVAGAALADQPYPPDNTFVSTKTRAEVVAELVKARANGEIINDNRYPGPTKPFKSTKTRAQVIAEMEQARARGEMPLNDYYNGGSATPVAFKSTKTRAQVQEELKEYRQAHADTGIADTSYVR